jgi:uncharacterized membrane protein
MARLFSIKPGITLKGRKFKGLRGWAGKPFHPPLTDVPLGAYMLAAGFDVLSFLLSDREVAGELYDAATFAIIGGGIVAIPTIATGLWDWWKSTAAHTQAWRTANWHMAVMLFVHVLVAVAILLRTTGDAEVTEIGILILTLAIAGIVSLGATYGGSLVYDYGFNVETAGDHPVWHESERDVLPGEDKAID